jgi:kynureninase
MFTGSAAERDARDPLAGVRERFVLPRDQIYLAGNSLGALPDTVAVRLERAVREEWGEGAVRSWNRADWIGAPRRVGDRLAPLLGARPGEVLVCDATSVNLFKLLGAALRLRPGREVVVCEGDGFPSDGYIAASAASWLAPGHRLRTVPRAKLLDAFDRDVAVVLLHHVDYRSAHRLPMTEVCEAARAHGVLTLWDVSHSAGAMPLELGRAGADLAVGCGYKYLCGGPGAPAFVYVRGELVPALEQPLQGWLGHRAPFAFEADYEPASGIERLLCGTPPILSLLAFEAALELLGALDPLAVRAKSEALGDFFIACAERECAGLGVEIASPRAARERGSQIALRHAEAYEVMQALIARGVIGDFREPDLLRFGLAPHYVRFSDVERAVHTLRDVLAQGAQRDPRYRQRNRVV